MTKIYSVAEAQQLALCIGCDRPKDVGLIVCWDYFKHHCPRNPKPLKYSYVTFENWQRHFTGKDRGML